MPSVGFRELYYDYSLVVGRVLHHGIQVGYALQSNLDTLDSTRAFTIQMVLSKESLQASGCPNMGFFLVRCSFDLWFDMIGYSLINCRVVEPTAVNYADLAGVFYHLHDAWIRPQEMKYLPNYRIVRGAAGVMAEFTPRAWEGVPPGHDAEMLDALVDTYLLDRRPARLVGPSQQPGATPPPEREVVPDYAPNRRTNGGHTVGAEDPRLMQHIMDRETNRERQEREAREREEEQQVELESQRMRDLAASLEPYPGTPLTNPPQVTIVPPQATPALKIKNIHIGMKARLGIKVQRRGLHVSKLGFTILRSEQIINDKMGQIGIQARRERLSQSGQNGSPSNPDAEDKQGTGDDLMEVVDFAVNSSTKSKG